MATVQKEIVIDADTRIQRATALIEQAYARPLRLAELAATAGMSPYHFLRVFRTVVGVTPHRYIIQIRLRAGVELLERGASVTSACYEVGFSSPSHFTSAFRREYGMVPSDVMGRRSRVA